MDYEIPLLIFIAVCTIGYLFLQEQENKVENANKIKEEEKKEKEEKKKKEDREVKERKEKEEQKQKWKKGERKRLKPLKDSIESFIKTHPGKIYYKTGTFAKDLDINLGNGFNPRVTSPEYQDLLFILEDALEPDYSKESTHYVEWKSSQKLKGASVWYIKRTPSNLDDFYIQIDD